MDMGMGHCREFSPPHQPPAQYPIRTASAPALPGPPLMVQTGMPVSGNRGAGSPRRPRMPSMSVMVPATGVAASRKDVNVGAFAPTFQGPQPAGANVFPSPPPSATTLQPTTLPNIHINVSMAPPCHPSDMGFVPMTTTSMLHDLPFLTPTHHDLSNPNSAAPTPDASIPWCLEPSLSHTISDVDTVDVGLSDMDPVDMGQPDLPAVGMDLFPLGLANPSDPATTLPMNIDFTLPLLSVHVSSPAVSHVDSLTFTGAQTFSPVPHPAGIPPPPLSFAPPASTDMCPVSPVAPTAPPVLADFGLGLNAASMSPAPMPMPPPQAPPATLFQGQPLPTMMMRNPIITPSPPPPVPAHVAPPYASPASSPPRPTPNNLLPRAMPPTLPPPPAPTPPALKKRRTAKPAKPARKAAPAAASAAAPAP
ncbi:hypothetical protein HDU96_005977, partial [Phlyctochytrium bullatum]